MDLNWLHSIIYGFAAGLADILPVSAQAHRVLLLKFFGVKGDMDLLNLLIRLAVIAALCMAVFEFFIQKKKMLVLENFSLAASMLLAMTAAVFINMAL